MSQNIRAAPGASVRHGKIENVVGSGFANMSDSLTRAKPSIAEPSKPIPSSKAFSSSAGAIATDFKNPKTSVNHNRIKRILRSSIVRSTNCFCLAVSGDMSIIIPNTGYARVNSLNYEKFTAFQRALSGNTLGDNHIGVNSCSVANGNISDYFCPSSNNYVIFNGWVAFAF